VAGTQPLHEQRYEAGVLVTVEDLKKNSGKVRSALVRVKGVQNVVPGGLPNEIVIALAPLSPAAKQKEFLQSIAEALQKAGLKFSGLPSAGPTGGGIGTNDEADPKRKAATAKGTPKSKGGSDDTMPEEKGKSARPFGNASPKEKAKPARQPAESPGKSKEGTPEDQPRFQILAVTGDKLYLADHEAKLKKFVKAGDKFGDFVVKEVGNDDGPFVVLENPETKDTIRVEKERKDKDKDKDKDGGKGKDDKAKDSKGSKEAKGKASKDKEPNEKESDEKEKKGN
jgi:hypothetical protein